jgi:transcriptional regulator with XRE-family HTH domain
MEIAADTAVPDLDRRIAERLRALRAERGWSLDDLAAQTSISRATLSRLENAEVSPTASVLNRLCAAHGLTLSRLMVMMEEAFPPLLRPADQAVWRDPASGFTRRSLSPPAAMLAGEVVDCTLAPATRIDYDRPPREGLEHHLVMQAGELHLTVDGTAYALHPGDCLRYRLFGASTFATPAETGARYLIFVV